MKGLELIKALKQATCDKCCKDFRTDICKNCDYIIIEKELKALGIINKSYEIELYEHNNNYFICVYGGDNYCSTTKIIKEEYDLLKEILKNE